jgi:aminoglycoside phosphotransferase (APT) family kinase protein
LFATKAARRPAYAALHAATWGAPRRRWHRAAAPDAAAWRRLGASVKVDARLAARAAAGAAAYDGPVCLCHGHARADHTVAGGLFSFGLAGVGPATADLGAYCIAALAPEERRATERALVATYARALDAELAAAGLDAAAAAPDACWRRYVDGGVAAWLALLPDLAPTLPPGEAQTIADRLAAFVDDHPGA